MQSIQEIQKKIQEKIHEFDLYALLQLLNYLGFRRSEILFKSNLTTVSTSNIVENIEFLSEPIKQVVIFLNFGLLSNQSPLPSYFFKTIENDTIIDEKALTDFLEFFNHIIVDNYLNNICPESITSLYSNWETVKRAYLRLAGVNSVALLHLMFSLVFPELGINVVKRKHKRSLKSDGMRLGYCRLAEGYILGAYASVPVAGFDVTLYCDEEYDRKDTWAEKIAKRLYTILFPILQEKLLDLKVILVIRSQKGWVQLYKQSYLGIDKIKGGLEKNRVVIIYDGLVKEMQCQQDVKDAIKK